MFFHFYYLIKLDPCRRRKSRRFFHKKRVPIVGITGNFFSKSKLFGKNTNIFVKKYRQIPNKNQKISKKYRKIQRKYREKTGNIFSKIEQILKGLDWTLSKKRPLVKTPKSVPSLHFFTFLYGFRYIKMLSSRHKTKAYFCKKVEKKSKIVKNLYISPGSSKRSLKWA